MYVLTSHFVVWLMGLTRVMRYLVVALLIHAAVFLWLGSVKMVVFLKPVFDDRLRLVPPPEPQRIDPPPKPFIPYRPIGEDLSVLIVGPVPGIGSGGNPKAGGGNAMTDHTPTMANVAGQHNRPGDIVRRIGMDSATLAGLVPKPDGADEPGTFRPGLGDPNFRGSGFQGPGSIIYKQRDEQYRPDGLPPVQRVPKAETAVLAGLRWLKSHQEPDGSWTGAVRGEGETALAVLAFLGHSETPDKKEFGPTVHKALEYLVSKVKANGGVASGNIYAQGLVTLALAEGYAMTGSPYIRDSLARATQFIVMAQNAPKQNPLHVGGWRYTPTSNDADLSVTGWQIMALKSAKHAGIDVPQEVFDKASRYLWSMYGQQGFGYTGPGAAPAMTGVGAFCAVFLGYGDDPRLRHALRYLKSQEVNWNKTEGSWVLYAWYYITHAMFQGGEDFWPGWNDKIRNMIIDSQADDGHWSCPPKSTWETKQGSAAHVYSTALCTMILEVYYRYLPMYKVLELEQKKTTATTATPLRN